MTNTAGRGWTPGWPANERRGLRRRLGAAPSLVAFRRLLTSRKSILASAPTKRLIPAFRTNVRGTMGRAGTTARTSRSPSRPRICGQPRGVGLAPVGGGRSATRHSRRVPLRFPACQTANANLSARWRSARSAPSRRLLFLRRRSLVKNGRPAAPMDRSRFSPTGAPAFSGVIFSEGQRVRVEGDGSSSGFGQESLTHATWAHKKTGGLGSVPRL